MNAQQQHRPLIVVGVDGSDRSKTVLAWAVQQARAVGGRMRVVLAWTLPELPGYEPPRVESQLSEAAEKRVAQLIAEAVATGYADAVVQQGGPVRVLLREAREADLLVIGRHGHGHEDGKPLGSVAQSCLMQAACPVAVIPV